jgi:hypothetical protein
MIKGARLSGLEYVRLSSLTKQPMNAIAQRPRSLLFSNLTDEAMIARVLVCQAGKPDVPRTSGFPA